MGILNSERDRLLKAISDKEAELEQLIKQAYPEGLLDSCAACGSKKVEHRIEIDRWKVLDIGEFCASVPVTVCLELDCGIRLTDWRTEEIRDLVTRHARGVLPK